MEKICNYNINFYDFRSKICKILETEDLENIHKQQTYEVFTRKTDQSTLWHRKFYDNFVIIQDSYTKFIKDFVKPLFNGEKIVYQKVPTFRVHLVGNLSVGEFHRDRDYRHLTTEVNFWVPFTNAYGTNTIWIESKENLNDFSPKELEYGQVLQFDGANLLHGNKINDTETTRVSMDFRVIPYSKFTPSANSSIFANKKFDIGDYFELME